MMQMFEYLEQNTLTNLNLVAKSVIFNVFGESGVVQVHLRKLVKLFQTSKSQKLSLFFRGAFLAMHLLKKVKMKSFWQRHRCCKKNHQSHQ